MTMKEKDIVHETKNAWVHRDTKGNCYTVYINTIIHSITDSSYPLTEDGLSLALVRCKYMDKRKRENKA